MVIMSESHLRRVIDEYVEHYHLERPHQGIGKVPVAGGTGGFGVPKCCDGPIRCHERLGGLLRSYYREAA